MGKHIGIYPKSQSYQANGVEIKPVHMISEAAPRKENYAIYLGSIV